MINQAALEAPTKKLEIVRPEPRDALADATPFEVRTLGDLLSDPILSRVPQWVLQRFFVRGSLNVIYGAGKLGKSTLLAYLAVAVATGQQFAGLNTIAGPVLWLDLEQGYGRLARSLAAVPGAAAPGIPLFVYSDLTDKGRSVVSLAATIAQNEFVLVIIDGLGKFAQIEDENDNAAWQRVLQVLEEIARSGTAAIVFIDHDRKSEGEHGRGLRGGSSKLAAMDCAVHMKRVNGKDATRRLEVVSRENGTFALDVTLGDAGYTSAVKPVDVIEDALTTGEMSMAALVSTMQARGFTTGRTAVRERVMALVDNGRVIVTGAGTKSDPLMYSLSSGSVADSFRQNDRTEAA